jgi:hypothetical protein
VSWRLVGTSLLYAVPLAAVLMTYNAMREASEVVREVRASLDALKGVVTMSDEEKADLSRFFANQNPPKGWIYIGVRFNADGTVCPVYRKESE